MVRRIRLHRKPAGSSDELSGVLCRAVDDYISGHDGVDLELLRDGLDIVKRAVEWTYSGEGGKGNPKTARHGV